MVEGFHLLFALVLAHVPWTEQYTPEVFLWIRLDLFPLYSQITTHQGM